jgi:DNA repair protein RecN (Recombination protein N)
VLTEELNLLTHAEELLNLEEEFRLHCYESENSVFDVLNGYLAQLNQFSEDSSKVKAATSLIEECMANLGEAGSELECLRTGIDLDPQRLKDVSDRFDYINSLKVKYGRSLSDLKTYCDEIEVFMDNYSSEKELLIIIEIELKENLDVLKKQAAKLTATRKKVAREFSQTIEKDIRKLSMPAAQVEVRLNEIVSNEDAYYHQVSPQGNDYAEFYFSANKGKSMQPLKIAASGGELSRFLLAIKKIHAQHLSSRTIVFDEIDTGIGGKTAELTGEYISDIARHHQVICITHLAQIAVFAESQFNISKMVTDDISQINVKMLDNKQKISEIARMLSGSDSVLALQHAEELIKKRNRTDNV